MQVLDTPRVIDPATNGFRLTLTSGTAVTTGDVTGATTLYVTPHKSDRMAVYTGSRWVERESDEFSKALGTLTADTNYDVFVYDNAGTLTVDSFVAWTNDTTRATALVKQDGVWVKSGATTRRYVGTFRTTSTTATEDSVSKRFVFNADNREGRKLQFQDNANHVYNTGTWRYWNDSDTSRVHFVQGVAGAAVSVSISMLVKHSSAGGFWFQGFGYDQNAGNDNFIAAVIAQRADTGVTTTFIGSVVPDTGYHYIAAVELAGTGATTTWEQAELQSVVWA